MAPASHLENLRRVPLFSSCSERELRKIARSTDEVQFAAGTVLMEQGQHGREAFVIVSGTASVEICGSPVAVLEAGQHVGELALLDRGPRTATVIATSDMEVLVISQRAFMSLLDSVPGLSRKVLTSLAGMVRDLDDRLEGPSVQL
jgi:CRP-like cAMP-binding protein